MMPPPQPAASSSSAHTTGTTSSSSDHDLAFTCNICLEGVKDREPVVTQCGHLYCWPCLYRWLHTRHSDGTCPVCKAGVTQDNVIPIFIRGTTSDPRCQKVSSENGDIIPNRPQGHRPEPVNPVLAAIQQVNNSNGLNMNYNAQIGGMSFAAGMGFFPSLFGLQFQSFAPLPEATPTNDSEEEAQRVYLSRVLLFLGISVILCLLFF